MPHHVISVEDLSAWMREPRWTRFATCGAANLHKRLEADLTGGGFRVVKNSETVYDGNDLASAVEAYNNAG